MKKEILFIISIGILLSACKNRESSSKLVAPVVDSLELAQILEAREDSVEFANTLMLQGKIENSITADFETDPVESLDGEDAADDPAIWINPKDPSKSLVLGTNKKAGLYVYDLAGNTLQYFKAGMLNNVDLRDGFNYKGKKVALVAASNRSNNSISLFYIDYETGLLSDTISNIRSGVDEVYGVSFFKDLKKNKFYVFVNGKGGVVEQWLISFTDRIEGKMVRSFTLTSQPEGMAVSDKMAMLYFGIEEGGIFKVPADPNIEPLYFKIPDSDTTNTNIVYDIEGLAIFNYKNAEFLIASSQGNFSYAIFKLGKNEKYITSFKISDSHIDGVEETDGLDLTTFPLTASFPEGMLVVQDGYNYKKDTLLTQNFKYVSFGKIKELISE